MAVPEEIRKVERPVNTVVRKVGSGIYQYAVIQRIGCRRKDGRCIPVEGKVIGHIIDGKYVEGKVKASDHMQVDLLDYADIVLVDRLNHDILESLYGFFDAKDAMRIYAMAAMRVCSPQTPWTSLRSCYENSWMQMLLPSLAMSPDSISSFIQGLGRHYSVISEYMRSRVTSTADGARIAIDGTLKNDTSTVNDLSCFSRKAKVKGAKDISVIFAYDIDKKEPICSKVYAGNVIDEVAYRNFLEENRITRGMIIADKGFPYKKAKDLFSSNRDLHWITPLKRNDKRIAANGLLSFEGVVDDKERDLLYRKVKIGDVWYCSFYDRRLAAKEEADYFRRHKGKKFSISDLEEKDGKFGTIVFECDQDLDPLTIYRAYDERWLVEEFFRAYKTATDFDTTNVHNDYSVIGAEFINFISSLMTSRLFHKFDELKLFDDMTYRQIMDGLARAKKVKTSKKSDWQFVRTTISTMDMIDKLGLK